MLYKELRYAVAGITTVMVTVPVEESSVFVTVIVMVALPASEAVGSLIVNVASAAFVAVKPLGSLPLAVTAASIAVFIAAAFVILASSLWVPSHVTAGTFEPIDLSTSA